VKYKLEPIKTVLSFLYGAAAGAGIVIVSYAKAFNPDGSHEPFDWEKAVKSVLIAAVVGGISRAFDVSPSTVELEMAQYGIVSFLFESTAKAIVRKARQLGWIK